MAHAASVFYWPTFDRAAIMTHDGFATGNGYHGGLFAFGDGTRLWPVSPHNLVLGAITITLPVWLVSGTPEN